MSRPEEWELRARAVIRRAEGALGPVDTTGAVPTIAGHAVSDLFADHLPLPLERVRQLLGDIGLTSPSGRGNQ